MGTRARYLPLRRQPEELPSSQVTGTAPPSHPYSASRPNLTNRTLLSPGENRPALGPERHTLPLGVQMFTTQFSASMTSIMAFTTLAAIPALIFFLAMQKYIVNGLAGAVKG